MTKFKRAVSVICVGCMALSTMIMGVGAVADMPLPSPANTCETVFTISNDDMTQNILSPSEYANILVDQIGLNPVAATAEAAETYANLTPRSQLIEFSREVTSAKYTVTYGVIVRCQSGPQPTFEEITRTYSAASGSGEYTWVENACDALIISPVKLQLVGSGNVTVVVTEDLGGGIGVSGGVNVPLGEIKASAEANWSVGSIHYYRLRLSWNTFIQQYL